MPARSVDPAVLRFEGIVASAASVLLRLEVAGLEAPEVTLLVGEPGDEPRRLTPLPPLIQEDGSLTAAFGTDAALLESQRLVWALEFAGGRVVSLAPPALRAAGQAAPEPVDDPAAAEGLDAAIRDAVAARDTAASTATALERQLTEANRAREGLEQQLAETSEERDTLHRQLIEVSAAHSHAVGDHAGVRATLAQASAEHEHALADRDQRESALFERIAELEQIAAEADRGAGERDTADARVSALRQELADARRDAETREQELARELEAMQARSAELEQHSAASAEVAEAERRALLERIDAGLLVQEEHERQLADSVRLGEELQDRIDQLEAEAALREARRKSLAIEVERREREGSHQDRAG